ncbi:uncharacterized protein LOC107427294 isoform X5 [Ziziphus jujuba]|nr:uncharacterized protein LOC107427294 isoform X5 [Ziziphus jujuba]XP_060676436.1 uncharacterized protein LOC107427294 isoform X5 [Ziziphus jujuba]XP_060676437.1 uncharacterized protein LOC107427294 isoform X5 [Ziziphus jujuba]
MAMNGRGKVLSDCNYASNPYHECTDYCLRKIAEGKGRKDKKKSDHGSARRDDELNKKCDEKKVHPSCPKASNPYHECDDDCVKRFGVEPQQDIGKTVAGSIFAIPIKAGRRKKHESESKPLQEVDKVPAQGKVYAPESPFLPSHFASAEKGEESESEEHFPSVPYSGEIHIADPPSNVKKVQSPQLVPTSGILAMQDNPKDPPNKAVESPSNEPPVDKKEDNNHHAMLEESPKSSINNMREITAESINFTFSGISNAFEESDDDESQSVISDSSSISVGKYRVKERVSSTLQAIFDKFGDIAASCKLESLSMRSYYLECLCFVVQELQSTSIKQLTKSKVKEMLAILKDVECAGIDVSWLRKVLNESMEDIELVSQQRTLGAAKANCDHDIELLRKQLESQMEDLALKEKEVAEAKKQVAESKAHLKELELKASVLDETLGTVKSKVATLQTKSILDGVL